MLKADILIKNMSVLDTLEKNVLKISKLNKKLVVE